MFGRTYINVCRILNHWKCSEGKHLSLKRERHLCYTVEIERAKSVNSGNPGEVL